MQLPYNFFAIVFDVNLLYQKALKARKDNGRLFHRRPALDVQRPEKQLDHCNVDFTAHDTVAPARKRRKVQQQGQSLSTESLAESNMPADQSDPSTSGTLVQTVEPSTTPRVRGAATGISLTWKWSADSKELVAAKHRCGGKKHAITTTSTAMSASTSSQSTCHTSPSPASSSTMPQRLFASNLSHPPRLVAAASVADVVMSESHDLHLPLNDAHTAQPPTALFDASPRD